MPFCGSMRRFDSVCRSTPLSREDVRLWFSVAGVADEGKHVSFKYYALLATKRLQRRLVRLFRTTRAVCSRGSVWLTCVDVFCLRPQDRRVSIAHAWVSGIGSGVGRLRDD